MLEDEKEKKKTRGFCNNFVTIEHEQKFPRLCNGRSHFLAQTPLIVWTVGTSHRMWRFECKQQSKVIITKKKEFFFSELLINWDVTRRTSQWIMFQCTLHDNSKNKQLGLKNFFSSKIGKNLIFISTLGPPDDWNNHESTLSRRKFRQFHSQKLKQENFHLHLNLNPRLEQFWWRTEENVTEFFLRFCYF